MTLSPTFERRYRQALQLERDGQPAAALDALNRIFDPLEEPSERRVASAEFCLKVELRKALVLVSLGRRDEAQELLEADWVWRLVNEADEAARRTFFQTYGEVRAGTGTPYTVEPAAALRKLQSAILGPHRLRGWESFFRGFTQ